MSKKLSIILRTTLTLLDQFQGALYAPTPRPTSSASDDESKTQTQDALPLLTASAETLKSQVTKLSLLAINKPFTPSAVITVLSALNESVLPSLVTAAILVTPKQYTKAFHAEVQILTKTTLKELASLASKVETVTGKRESQRKEEDLSQSEKDAVTIATGRVWDSCDALFDVATKGVVGFVIRRVEQWRDLVKDAVEEIEEWDPDEDDPFDDLLGDDGKNSGSDEGDDGDDDEKKDDDDDNDTATSQANKKSALCILKPVGQIFPAIVSNRLKNAGNAPLSSKAGVPKLESLMTNLQRIPEDIDEVAGALYEANWGKYTQFLEKVKGNAAKAVELVASPWVSGVDEKKMEDKFTTWSKTWLKVMDEVGKSIGAVDTNSK